MPRLRPRMILEGGWGHAAVGYVEVAGGRIECWRDAVQERVVRVDHDLDRVLQERGALHGARLAEASLDPAAPLAQQAALLAGMDVFWVLMWVGLGGAALLLRQRAFD